MGILWFKGYTVLEIESLCAERFFNLCANRGIRIHKLYPDGEKCIFTTSIDDYYKLKPIVKKDQTAYKNERKKGLSVYGWRSVKASVFHSGNYTVCGGNNDTWAFCMEYKA